MILTEQSSRPSIAPGNTLWPEVVGTSRVVTVKVATVRMMIVEGMSTG
jgi:hypothetical protein